MSPKLFIACLKKIFKTTDSTKKGTNREKLNHVRFTDDIIIIAHAVKNIDVMLQELDNTSRKCGLKKTKSMTGTTRITKAVYVNGIQLGQVEEYVYLGQRFILIEKNQGNEIRSRIKTGWRHFENTAQS